MTYGVYATGIEDYGSTPAWAGTSPIPSVAVEVAFTTNPGATPVWVNIGERVKQFTVHRGRADELTAFSAGQATITLNNEDRAFDPSYTSSPYYPNVVPMRRIRIRATYNAVTYDVFSGYVTNWQQQYRHPSDADAVVEATDAFKVLGNITLAGSVYEREVRADSPSIWFRLNDASGSTSILDAIAARNMSTSFGTPSLGATGLVTRDPGTALSQADAVSGWYDRSSYFPVGSVSGFSFECILKTTMTGPGYAATFMDTTATFYVTLGLSASNRGIFQVYNGTAWGVQGTTTINDGNPHHVCGTWDGTTARLYVDGALQTTDVGTTATAGSLQEMCIGNLALGFITSGGHSTGLIGTIDEVAYYPSILADTRIAAHSAARATPWQGDLTGARLGRLLDAAGWPAADRNIDTGNSTLQSADLGSNALSAVQAVEQTEFGALFVTGGGLVRFIARDSLLKAPYATSQATFGDSGAELEFGDLTFEYDDKLIYNEAKVSRSNGAAQTVGDTTSQAKYLKRTKTVSGLLYQSDATSVDAANWIVNHYKDPLLRVTGMRLEPSANNDTTHYPQVLGRDLLDRVTINRRPQNLGAAITQDSQIQGITHTVTPREWITHWDLSPAETQVYWIAGVAGFSEAGQTTRAGF